MEKQQKERLEQELRFLKESFEAEVISKEEFEKGKERIERKLKEMDPAHELSVKDHTAKEEPKDKAEESKGKNTEEETDDKSEEKTEEKAEDKEEKEEADKASPLDKNSIQILTDEKKETNTEEKAPQEEIKELEEKFHISDEETQEAKTEAAPKVTVVDIEEPDQQDKISEAKPETKEKKKSHDKPGYDKRKLAKYGFILFIILFSIGYGYYFLSYNENIKPAGQETETPISILCYSDVDCTGTGKDSVCINPGTKESKCEAMEIKETAKTSVIVLNDRQNCFNCDTQRVLGILADWFGQLNAREVSYSSDEGKSLAAEFNPRMLPLYILEDGIAANPSFEQFKRAFTKKNDNYVLSEDAGASAFYVERSAVQNQLDIFVITGDEASARAEKNLDEFLQNFKDIKFSKHAANDNLTAELGIKTFPSFLVNNKVRFNGVQPADAIRENFCRLNTHDACGKKLSKSLV